MSNQVRLGSFQGSQVPHHPSKYARPTSNMSEKHQEAIWAAAAHFTNHFMAASNNATQGNNVTYMTNPFLAMNKVCLNPLFHN
jgi:hypothetical protein